MFVKDNFFHKRRSVMANKMDSSPIEKKDIDNVGYTKRLWDKGIKDKRHWVK